MQIRQLTLHQDQPAPDQLATLQTLAPQLLLVFAAPAYFERGILLSSLQAALPGCVVLGCSTAGEIASQGVEEGSAVLTAIRFGATRVASAATLLQGMQDAQAAGQRLATALQADDLQLLLLLAPGTDINGTALLDGLQQVLGDAVPVVGGMAADDGRFCQTFTLHQAAWHDHQLVAVGLYGQQLQVGHGSCGGWSTFGPARQVSRCQQNILYELDGAPALDVYKRYLGEYATALPGSGLLFPFAMLGSSGEDQGVIRAILGVNEQDGSLTLAGELANGSQLKLMHAGTDSLVRGAEQSASDARLSGADQEDSLALLVSCVGRKLVMGDRVDEEVEAVADVLGKQMVLAGFYSNGEISPFAVGHPSRLHNQTMTITTLREITPTH
jgi:hypothetical protein